MSIYLSRNTEALRRTDPAIDAWFPKLPTTFSGADLVLQSVERWGRKHFGDKIVMRETPTGFGMQLLLHALPDGIHYEAVPDGVSKILHGNVSLPHRFETFSKGKGYEHDCRVAFLAATRAVPVYFRDSFTHDVKDEYIPYRQGWYLADVTVPAGWSHIGLVPSKKVTKGDQPTYEYPSTPGAEFTYWFHKSEIRLLQAKGWPFAIRQRMLFAPQRKGYTGGDPLRLWHERLCDGIVNAEAMMQSRADQRQEWAMFRAGLRAAALSTIGQLNFNGRAGESTIFNGDTWVEMPTREPTPYLLRFHHPEWWAAIIARTRVQTTMLALQVPKDELIAIRGDAVITKSPIPGLVDSGKVGAYRLKGVQ